MPIPEPMLSTRAAAWPSQGDWMMEPKWDGFRLNSYILHLLRHRRQTGSAPPGVVGAYI
jgi:ATP-dependent DNA ligase